MSVIRNATDFRIDQYRDPARLEARTAIHARFSTNPRGWFQWIFEALSRLPSDSRILELGCGAAHLWAAAADRIPPGWNITLSDSSAGMLDAAWRNLVVLGRSFKFEQIDAQSIPYEDNTFDAVVANHMLYHVPDLTLAIGEIQRSLKPGGRLFAATVGSNHMREMQAWIRQVARDPQSGGFSISFSLENGIEHLAPMFGEVLLKRYEDSLEVTEVGPILVYLRSMVPSSDLDEDHLAELGTGLEARLRAEKKIHITKESGLFEALN